MGCTGSKPNLLNYSANHANSPQKGFIIFNAKTIEYIKAHENELKQKIKERCDQKLFANKTIKIKGKKLKLNELTNECQQQQQNIDNEATPSPNNNNDSLLNATIHNHEKEVATVDSVIDLVLKYIVEDFDIENFKSNSNHLLLKQIKKDILKKYNNVQATAANITISSDNSNNNNNNNNKTNTLTPKSTTVDSSFYKKALTTAIDEFGAVIQEQFIQIADFKVPDKEIENVETAENDETKKNEKNVLISERNDIPIIDDNEIDGETTYTLKEALELARQNFYNGKKSMVLMTKLGRYILRDAPLVTETSNIESPKSSPTVKTENTPIVNDEILVTPVKPKTVTMFDTETKKTSKVAIAPEINIEDVDISATFKIIEASLDEEHVQKLMNECKSPAKVEAIMTVPNIVPYEIVKINEINNDENSESKEISNQTVESDISTKTPENTKNDDFGVTATTTTTTITTTTTTVVDENDEKTRVDVKKEIAISILNIGEVLAKTIDHYSIENETTNNVNNNNNFENNVQKEPEQQVEILSPPPPPSPSIQTSTPASISSIDVEKGQETQEDQSQSLTQQQQQQQNDSTSFSSPSDLISSLSSSSALSSPSKKEENKKVNGNILIEDNMSFLMRTMESQISAQLDLYADKIAQSIDAQKPSQNDENVKEFIQNVIETATNKIDDDKNETGKNDNNFSEIDDVILRQIYEVDRKVQSVVETCSEDDYEDDNINEDNEEKLFQPIKSNRIDVEKNIELREEIKQISNVIHDLVQTMVVSNNSEKNEETVTKLSDGDQSTTVNTNSLDSNNTNSDVEIRVINDNYKPNDRKSISSISSNSNIPIRKILTKQKATIDDEMNGNNHSFNDITYDSFNESNCTNSNSARNSLEPNTTPDIMSVNTSNGKGSKKKFKSKLPIKK